MVFAFRLQPPLPTLDISCYVLSCAYAYAKVCVCVCVFVCLCMCVGPHMPMHLSSLLIFMRVCVLSPPAPLWCPLHVKSA